MKKFRTFLLIPLAVLISVLPLTGQGTGSPGKKTIVYTFVFNKVPDGFNFPLIGFLNFADGSHASAHIGFINWNQKNFRGLQLSFINTAGGEVAGTQTGFINTSGGSFNGLQLGFVNTVANNFKGAQVGFVNTLTGTLNGLQMSFINTSTGQFDGMQLGFVNTSVKSTNGLQLGFINSSRMLRGLQFGFLNYADTIKTGFPFGFMSFVRKGGYQALEISLSESFPFNLAFKSGIKALYTSLIASWNPHYGGHYALGLGLGSIIPFSKSVYFNPEVTVQWTYPDYHEIYGLTTQLGFALNRRLNFSLGPSLVWLNRERQEYFYDPLFYFYEYRINAYNKLVMGARVSLKYNFSK